MFTKEITRRDYDIYIKYGKPKFINICCEKTGDKYMLSLLEINCINGQLVNLLRVPSIKSKTNERSLEFSSSNCTFCRIVVRTPDDIDDFASKFGLVAYFSNATYYEGWRMM